MNDEDTPEQRLDRILRRKRRKSLLICGGVVIATLAMFVFVFGTERKPQGPEAAQVVSRTQEFRDDSVVYRYRLELAGGLVFSMSARAIHGINVGDTICVQRLRHPVFGGESIQRLPNSRCDLP